MQSNSFGDHVANAAYNVLLETKPKNPTCSPSPNQSSSHLLENNNFRTMHKDEATELSHAAFSEVKKQSGPHN